MGADNGMSGSVSRSGLMLAHEVPPLPQCIPLDPISLGSQKYTRSGEVRRAMGFSLGSASEDHPLRVPSYKPSPLVATEELKQFKENVVDASMKARERSKMLNESLYKLEKYREAMGLRKRHRSELLPNEKPSGPNLLKMMGQSPRDLLDQSAQRFEDKAKCAGSNKRVRSSAVDLRVDNRSGFSSKDQTSNGKEANATKPITSSSVHPEERTRRLSAMGEGLKRKRSVGAVINRSADVDAKRTMHAKLTDSKLTSCDTSTLSHTTVIKGKISRAPRTGSVMAVNSSSDVQATSEVCEGWEQPTSTSKVVSLGLMQNHHGTVNSSQPLGKWVVQRQQKSSRSRRANVVSPVSNHDEGQTSPLSFPLPGTGTRNSVNGTSGCLETVVHNNIPKAKLKAERAPSPIRLSEGEENGGVEQKLEEKKPDCSGVSLNGKGKVRAFHYPMKRNKNVIKDCCSRCAEARENNEGIILAKAWSSTV